MVKENEQLVEQLFRKEYGKLLAILTRLFGPHHIQLAEDIVQETLISALNTWSTAGVPSNPTGWLIQVAKRKALNELKRNKMIQKHRDSEALTHELSDEIGSVFLNNEIRDSQLRMVFTCCHASLDVKSQIALTLKTLCGFGVKEVANALLTTESTINKKLYRAKEKIRNSQIPFSIPQGNVLKKKLDTVSLTLYLLFNEGYNSTAGESVIRKELCLEAIRLVKLLVDYFDDNHKICALLSLMCFHTARFDARIDNKGAIILFEDQDRNLWNKDLINIGMHYLKKSIYARSVSSYHIEARIAAEHCMSDSFEQTNWQSIYDQYMLLAKLKPNPIIKLNLAIIQSKLQSIEVSLLELEKLAKKEELKDYHLLPATQGIFYMKLKDYQEAIAFLTKSLALKPSKRESIFIKDKIVICKKLLSTN
ncbi:MAG: sigma-70 family RNA polymerase sigma factor [Bacteroidota bacterium]